ncbi:MAG: DUF1828 domain-containing protein [Gammaproteobacteria bacterium]
MNCANLLENLGYTCAPRQNGALRLWSPFTFDDGEHLGLFLEPSGNGQWLVTDHADTLMHASAHGAELTPYRLNKIRAQFADVKISEGGALMAVTDQDNLARTVTEVLNTAIAISHAEESWRPKTREQKFIATVGQELEAVAGKKLQRNITVSGVSGHQIKFPFAIDDPAAGRQFIQPVAYGDERVDWGNVYKASGQMFDLKSAGAEESQRIVIVEDSPGDEELGKAVTLLSYTSIVLLFSHRDQWLPRFRRAA